MESGWCIRASSTYNFRISDRDMDLFAPEAAAAPACKETTPSAKEKPKLILKKKKKKKTS
jgi:hypothetical protein